MSVSLSCAALTKVFASSTGINDDVDKELIVFRSLFDGPRNRSRRRYNHNNNIKKKKKHFFSIIYRLTMFFKYEYTQT